MKYRTALTDPKQKQDRPKQAFHGTAEAAAAWSVTMLQGASDEAYVTVYLEVEVPVHTYTKTKAPGATQVE